MVSMCKLYRRQVKATVYFTLANKKKKAKISDTNQNLSGNYTKNKY